MPVVYIDGPEKSGKTTLARRVVGASRPLHAVHVGMRWQPGLDGSVYRDALRLGARPDTLVVIDRGWVSDAVYGQLVRRQPAHPAWWYDWCLGTAAATMGIAIVLAPPHRLAPLAPDDHPIDYGVERAAFVAAATRPLVTVATDPGAVDPTGLVDEAIAMYNRRPCPPAACTTVDDPALLVVGQARNTGSREPLAWAPLSTRYWRVELAAGGLLADVQAAAWRVATTNAVDLHSVPPALLARVERVITYGHLATRAARGLPGAHEQRVHPAARWRWGRYRQEDSR